MKRITIYFEEIVPLRKFEASLQFLSLPYQIDESSKEIIIDTELWGNKPYKVEIKNGFASIGFDNTRINS